ncbi:MAG: HEAT repeat domain-containing protein [Planctomycetota bacterium]
MVRRSAAILLGAAILAGCRTDTVTPRAQQTEEAKAYEDYVQSGLFCGDDLEFLVALDDRIREWNRAHEQFEFQEEHRLAADIRRAVNQRMEFLVHVLGSRDLEGRLVAASALGFSGDRAAVDPLLGAAGDENTEVRTNALYAIGLLGNRETTMEPLLAALGDRSGEVRAAAAFAICGTVGPGADRGSYDALVAALKDEEWKVQNHAVRALGVIQRPDTVPLLLAGPLRSEAYLVRLNTAAVLAIYKAPTSIEPLIELLMDQDVKVVKMAAFALEKITGESYGNDRAKWLAWWREARERFLPPPPEPEPPAPPDDK